MNAHKREIKDIRKIEFLIEFITERNLYVNIPSKKNATRNVRCTNHPLSFHFGTSSIYLGDHNRNTIIILTNNQSVIDKHKKMMGKKDLIIDTINRISTINGNDFPLEKYSSSEYFQLGLIHTEKDLYLHKMSTYIRIPEGYSCIIPYWDRSLFDNISGTIKIQYKRIGK